MVYKTPIEDFKYNLEMLNYDSLVSNIEKFKDYDAETLLSIVSEIGRLNEQEALALARLSILPILLGQKIYLFEELACTHQLQLNQRILKQNLLDILKQLLLIEDITIQNP